MTDLADRIEREGSLLPSKGEFHCGRCSGRSVYQIVVSYDTLAEDEYWARRIRFDGFTVCFDVEHTEEVIAAIRHAAAAIRARMSDGR